MPFEFSDILEFVADRRDLSPKQAEEALKAIVSGNVSHEEISAFLLGMRSKGETVDELTAFVRVMRDASVNVAVECDGAVDLCGTGGDKSGTFNISTAAMFVVAGAGVPVLKHGNRSVSSRSGSADVLEALGAVATLGKEGVEEVFNATGMAFMFAPNFHPAMKHVMPARRALGIRTFFNILGPMLNPAGVRRQVIGAFNRETAVTIASILEQLDTEKAFTLHAKDGLDEVSLTTETEIFAVPEKTGRESELFDPQSLGLKLTGPESLAGGDAGLNAEIIHAILNETSTEAQRDIVLVNAAFAIEASGKVSDRADALQEAKDSISSGRALKKLNNFIEASNSYKPENG